MGKKYNHLLEQIVDINNLRNAYKKTSKNKRYKIEHLLFKENLEVNLLSIQEELSTLTYKRGDYFEFEVRDPKKRIISALGFKDRIVQHAIHNIIEPIFDKTFYPTNYACRKNKGTHKGVIDVQSQIRRMGKNGEVFYLKMDFKKYFYSIDINILFVEIERKISDKRVIRILRSILDGEIGIKVGNLLSQLCANIYGHIFDRYVKTILNVKNYFRYMDDTIILSTDKEWLKKIINIIKKFALDKMKMIIHKWGIQSISNKSLNFLGYRISSNYKLIRKDSVTRARRKIKYYRKINNIESLKKFLASWNGHIQWSDSYNLKKALYAQ
jgi:RNA-directed DNA polymerase